MIWLNIVIFCILFYCFYFICIIAFITITFTFFYLCYVDWWFGNIVCKTVWNWTFVKKSIGKREEIDTCVISLFHRCSMEIKIPQMRYVPGCPSPPSPVTCGYDLWPGSRASACVSKCTAVKYQVSCHTHTHIFIVEIFFLLWVSAITSLWNPSSGLQHWVTYNSPKFAHSICDH